MRCTDLHLQSDQTANILVQCACVAVFATMLCCYPVSTACSMTKVWNCQTAEGRPVRYMRGSGTRVTMIIDQADPLQVTLSTCHCLSSISIRSLSVLICVGATSYHVTLPLRAICIHYCNHNLQRVGIV